MIIARYRLNVSRVPVDFFSDPDGEWDFEELIEAAGFDALSPGICVGALTQNFGGHPEGSAVVVEMAGAGLESEGKAPYLAIVEHQTRRTEAAPSLRDAAPLPVSIRAVASRQTAETVQLFRREAQDTAA